MLDKKGKNKCKIREKKKYKCSIKRKKNPRQKIASCLRSLLILKILRTVGGKNVLIRKIRLVVHRDIKSKTK